MGRKSFRRLYINTDRTSDTLSEKLVQLFNALSTYGVFEEWLDVVVDPYDDEAPQNRPAIESIRTAFRVSTLVDASRYTKH